MSQYKIIMIVSSCINFDKSPLSYLHTRSVFSPEERLEQTIVTLRKIREKIPNAYILLTNNNSLLKDQYELLKPYCDHILINDEPNVRTHPNKSFSECYSLLEACRYIENNNIDFDYVFKTSGRYHFLNEFDIDKWPFNETKIVSPRAGNGVVNNIIYSVSKQMFYYYMERLKQAIELCNEDLNASKEYCVETILFDYKNPNVHEFLNIPAYIGGMCAVQPRVWWSC